MKKIHLILVLLFAFVALICTSGVASAFNTKYIGNTMVDLYWTEYKNTDFSKYELWRDRVRIATITDQRTTFYRDTRLTKGKIYDYEIYIYNATGRLKDKHRAHPYRNFPTGYVYGTITRDTTWTVLNGPYYNADWGVDVRNGSTLTIERGVIIKGIIRIYEKGMLYAHGVSFCNASIEIYSSHADIKDCFLESASAHGGISLDNSNNIKLTSFTNFGFSLGNGSSNNVISNNTGCGIGLRNANNNVITNNTLSEYWVCGINLLNSNDNDITGNTFSNNRKCMRWQGRKGIRVLSSNDNLITGNTFLNDHCGIYLFSSNNNVITDNIASNNYYGIYLDSSSNRNRITGNTVSNNSDCGIHLRINSSNNKIYNNYFNNTYNTYDDGKNTWNIAKTAATNIVGGPYLGGNYWCDYNGTDLDGDRLGDTVLPYNCSGGIENGGDYHPLITTRSNIVTIANNQVGEHYLWGAEGQIPRDGGEVIMAAPYVEQIVGRKTAHHTAQETTAGSHYCSGRHAHSEVTRLPHGDPDNQTHQANYRAYSWERFDWRCKDYVYGEACEGHRHFDCSGLVYFVYNQTGVPLVRNTAAGYAEMDTDIARADLKPGDVCYRGTKHIGIYVGGNQITHAAGHDKGVITTPLDASWNGFGCLLPPIVESTVPAKDAKCVPLNTNIVVNFDGKMDKASVESAFSISPSVSGTFTWSNTDKTLTFNPSSDLKKKTTYTVTIGTGAKDLGGNGIDGDADGREGPAYSWSFETVDTKNLDCGKDTMCLSQNKCSKFMMMDR